MTHSELDVRHVAHLARIELTDSETATFQAQIAGILDYVDQLNRVDVSNVEPTAHANAVFNVFRKDEPGESLQHDAALANAPHSANGLIVVTKVIE